MARALRTFRKWLNTTADGKMAVMSVFAAVLITGANVVPSARTQGSLWDDLWMLWGGSFSSDGTGDSGGGGDTGDTGGVGGSTGGPTCGDMTCDSAAGEDIDSCFMDCGSGGDTGGAGGSTGGGGPCLLPEIKCGGVQPPLCCTQSQCGTFPGVSIGWCCASGTRPNPSYHPIFDTRQCLSDSLCGPFQTIQPSTGKCVDTFFCGGGLAPNYDSMTCECEGGQIQVGTVTQEEIDNGTKVGLAGDPICRCPDGQVLQRETATPQTTYHGWICAPLKPGTCTPYRSSVGCRVNDDNCNHDVGFGPKAEDNSTRTQCSCTCVRPSA